MSMHVSQPDDYASFSTINLTACTMDVAGSQVGSVLK